MYIEVCKVYYLHAGAGHISVAGSVYSSGSKPLSIIDPSMGLTLFTRKIWSPVELFIVEYVVS